MPKYFNVKIQYKEESDSGKVHNVNEMVITAAISPTEAEAKVVKHLTEVGETRDYAIKAAGESKIVEVIN